MIQRLYKHPVNLVGRWTECTTDPEWGCGHAGTDNTWPGANGKHRYWCYVDDNGVAGNNYRTCSPTCTNGTVTPHDEITEASTKHNAKVLLSDYTGNDTCEENNGFWNGTTCYEKLGLPEDCKSCDDGYILDGRKCTECAGQTQYKCTPSQCCEKKTECPSGQILVTNDDPARNNDCEPCAGKTHYQCTPSQCCEKKTQCPPRQTLVTNEDPARNNHCEPFTATCEHGTPKTPDTTKVNGEDCASCHSWYFMNYGDVDEGDVCEPRDPEHTTTYNGNTSPTYRCTTDPEWGCGHAGTDNTWPGANGKHRYWCYLDQGGVAGSEYMTCSPTCTNGTVTSEDDIQENTIKHNALLPVFSIYPIDKWDEISGFQSTNRNTPSVLSQMVTGEHTPPRFEDPPGSRSGGIAVFASSLASVSYANYLSDYTGKGTCEESNGFLKGTTCYEKLGLPEDCKSCDDGYILEGRKCIPWSGISVIGVGPDLDEISGADLDEISELHIEEGDQLRTGKAPTLA